MSAGVFVIMSAIAAAPVPVEKPCALRAAAVLASEWHGDIPRTELAPYVDELLAGEHFVETFSRFVNTRFNHGFAMAPEEDAPYYVVRHVLTNNLPWTDLFLGRYGWTGPSGYPKIIEDAYGVGYFTAPGWVRRYAGNDVEGLMILAAYRVVHNLLGIKMVPSPFNASSDSDAVGRQREPCRSCHIDNPIALDKVAEFFPRRAASGPQMQIVQTTATPQVLLGDRTLTSLRELVEALIATDDFRFATCRLVFEFLYGRPENACEAPVFDTCVDAMDATNDIRQGIKAVVMDPSFCPQ